MTYFDAFKGKQILKKNYKNNDDIINCILKTVHIPYLSNGSMTYKDGCIDGAFPYMFKKRYKNSTQTEQSKMYLRKKCLRGKKKKIYQLE